MPNTLHALPEKCAASLIEKQFYYNDVPKITIDLFTRPLLNNRARTER